MSSKQGKTITDESKGNGLLANVKTPPADVNQASLVKQQADAKREAQTSANPKKSEKGESAKLHADFMHVGLRVYDVDAQKNVARLTKAEDLMTIMSKGVFAEMIPSSERGVTFRYNADALKAWVESVPRKVKAVRSKSSVDYKMFSVDTYDGVAQYTFAQEFAFNKNVNKDVSGIITNSLIATNVFANCTYDDVSRHGTLNIYRDGKNAEFEVIVKAQREVRTDMFSAQGEYLKDGQPVYTGNDAALKNAKQAERLMYVITISVTGKDDQPATETLSEMGLTNVLRAVMRRYTRIIVS